VSKRDDEMREFQRKMLDAIPRSTLVDAIMRIVRSPIEPVDLKGGMILVSAHDDPMDVLHVVLPDVAREECERAAREVQYGVRIVLVVYDGGTGEWQEVEGMPWGFVGPLEAGVEMLAVAAVEKAGERVLMPKDDVGDEG